MPSQKQFLKPQKTGKKKPLPPETDDEFLAAGVKEEEAGEKWRAGDAAKSYRFFSRAIEIYDAGLRKHPGSFDLAYNKARLQYDVSQQPRLLAHEPIPLIELLFTALASHRYALTIELEDTDALFNTAQLCVSIAEVLVDDSALVGNHDRGDATSLLKEAITLFQKCHHLQESQLEEADALRYLEPVQVAAESPQPVPLDSTDGDLQDHWASVKETVTVDTLLDTLLAQLNALTSLVPLLGPDQTTYSEIENQVVTVVTQAKALPHSEEATLPAQQAYFNATTALADYAYRSNVISTPAYTQAVQNAWEQAGLATFGPGLCDHADALITLSQSTAFDGSSDSAAVRWQALAAALDSLKSANQDPGPASRVAINTRRGDAELLRARLAASPIAYPPAIKSRSVLINNAGTYYEGARKLAVAEGDQDTSASMTARVMIVKGLQEGSMAQVLAGLNSLEQNKIERMIGEMADDGLIDMTEYRP